MCTLHPWVYLLLSFLSLHALKGLVLCRQRAPLVLTLQPVMNSVLLYLFLTTSRCEEKCHDTEDLVCPKKEISCFVLSCNFDAEIISRALILRDYVQRNYTRVGDMDCIFCKKTGMCVQQPWQSISLWSVADRFLSTFSFILICGSSLSPSHAENEVSRLETALNPPVKFHSSLSPVPFLWQTLCFLRAQRKSMPLGICSL